MRHRVLEAYNYGGRIHQVGDIVEMSEGARRVRLHTRSFFNNHLHEGGDVIELPPDVEGPHKSSAVSHDRIDYTPPGDANRLLGDMMLQPLFDVIGHEPVVDEKPVEHAFGDDVQRSGLDSAHDAARHVSEILAASREPPKVTEDAHTSGLTATHDVLIDPPEQDAMRQSPEGSTSSGGADSPADRRAD